MEFRRFGQTDMKLSAVALGGLLAHYEGVHGHPPPIPPLGGIGN